MNKKELINRIRNAEYFIGENASYYHARESECPDSFKFFMLLNGWHNPFVRMFNKETDKKFDEIGFPDFLYFDLTIWVSHDTATDEEKELHKKEIETCGGFLKTLGYKKAFRLAWDKADKEEHKELLTLPNWNNEIFREISGIDAEAEIAKESEDIE